MDEQRIESLKALGQLVRERRQQAGASQEELAVLSGLDRTYISGVERGVRNPSLTALLKIAAGLGLSLSVLLEGLEERVLGGGSDG